MSNTITAYFKGRVGVAESVYQNDYGIVMVFDSIDLPAHFDCYFSVPGSDTSTAAIGADNRVVIPNSVLGNSGSMTVHIPLHTGENDSEVEYVVYFKVIGRARPEDDGTPTQMTAIERALALLSQPITNIEEIVNEALSFTGDTFAEMKQELQDDFDNYTDTLEGDLATWKGGVESDFDNLEAQFDTAVAAVTTDTEVTNIRVGDDNVIYTTAGEAVRKQFSNVKADIDEISEEVTSTNVYDESAGIPQRYINETNGNLEIGGDYTAWDYMDISQWDTIVISRTGTLSIAIRYALYDSTKTFISGGTQFSEGSVDTNIMRWYVEIPRNGAKYIRISYLTSAISSSVMFSVGGSRLYQPFNNKDIPKDTNSLKTLENFVMGQKMPMAKADTMVGWSYLALTDNNIQSGDEIIFYGRLSTAMGRIDIGHMTYDPAETGLRLLVDGTNLQWIINGSPSSPIPHGLSIKDYIRISVKIYRNGNYDIRIDTNGGTYIRNGNTFYNGYYGSVRVDVYNMTLVDCALMQVIPTLMSKVWIFGDSYLSYHTERWSYYMYEDGIKDVLLNGFAGQASASAYDSFSELINYGNPQYVIWALGMNNSDYDSEPNPSWQVMTQNVINACAERGITPILCTIPNVPNVKNTLKNNFVRASGLQYIDFAKAVNADTEGSTWYDGMLSSDDTHPTADGAKALYSRFLVDFPQIFNRNNNTLI